MKTIETKVKDLVRTYETTDPFQLAKHLGIKVIFEALGGNLGFYTKIRRMKQIHINESTTEEQQRFICAHELGHAILHANENTSFLKKYTLYSTNRIETEANYFATQLLFKSGMVDSILIEEAEELYKLPKEVTDNNY